MELSINRITDGDGRPALEVVGAVDLQSRDVLIDAGRAQLDTASPSALVLDLSKVTFLDSTGIGAIVELSRDTAEVGRDFIITNPSARVVRILEVTGLLQEWAVEFALDAPASPTSPA